MTDKEKITTLVNMGFTIDEAMALASGNYRTVPDGNKQPEQKPEQEPPEQEPPVQLPKPDFDMPAFLDAWGKTLSENITKAIITQNILQEQQPAKQSPEDILGLMLEPKAPEMMGGK